MPFIHKLEAQYSQAEANVLAIGHGGTYRSMMPLLLSNVDYDSPVVDGIGYTTPVVTERRGDEWVCLQWGENIFES
jgi:broad specificity phosphatase PhoE